MLIKGMDADSLVVVVDLAQKLWPDAPCEELEEDFESLLNSDEGQCLVGFLENNEAIGFLQLSVRRDYVEGSHSSPVAYVEGIYIEPKFRGCGYAKQLILEGQVWGKSMGYAEMGSDVELHNTESMAFHEAIGFTEANRVVSYIKSLE